MAKIVVEPKPTVFISYASEDRNKAKKLYRDLKKAGAEPWLDREDILGGQRWETTIRTAIRSNRYFAALLSSRSVNKRGVVQKEIADALDILKEFPPDDIYLIPIRLDDCKPSHEELNKIQWIDMFPKWPDGFKEILKSFGIMRELVLDFDFMSVGGTQEGRPLLPITMRNPQNDSSVSTFGLIDTGADVCAAPAGFMRLLGYKVSKGERLMVSTAGGVTIAYRHTVQLEIHQQSKRKIIGDVVFVSDPLSIDSLYKLHQVLIGKNFLEQFHIDIDYSRQTLTIRI